MSEMPKDSNGILISYRNYLIQDYSSGSSYLKYLSSKAAPYDPNKTAVISMGSHYDPFFYPDQVQAIKQTSTDLAFTLAAQGVRRLTPEIARQTANATAKLIPSNPSIKLFDTLLDPIKDGLINLGRPTTQYPDFKLAAKGVTALGFGAALGFAVNEILNSQDQAGETSKQAILAGFNLFAAEGVALSLNGALNLVGLGVGAAATPVIVASVGVIIAGYGTYELSANWDSVKNDINSMIVQGLSKAMIVDTIIDTYLDNMMLDLEATGQQAIDLLDHAGDFIDGLIDIIPGLVDPDSKDLPPWLDGLLNALDAAHQGSYAPPAGGAPRLGNESPLVIDMDGDGIELTDAQTDAVYWDVDKDGFKDASAWVAPDDALLVMDRNGNGTIDNHGELFGNQTDGFQILSALDSNADGKISSLDTQFAQLKIWQDLNQDGVSQATELKTLTEAGIQSISLSDVKAEAYAVANNNITSSSLVTMADGSTKTIVDAWFKYNDANTLYDGDYALDPRTLYLPTLRGYGEIKDLHIAMSLDGTLLTRVDALAQMTLANVLNITNNFDLKFREVLYEWSGSVTDQQWRDSAFQYDLRKTQFIDDMSGRNYTEGALIAGQSYTYQPTMLTAAWESVQNSLEARFLSQTVFKSLFLGTPVYNSNTDIITGITGISSTGLNAIATLINGTTDKEYGWTLVSRVIEGSIGIDNLSAGDRTLLDNAISASLPGQNLAVFDTAITLGIGAGTIAGTTGVNNTLTGNAVDNVIEGRELNDTLNGGAGDDRLFGWQGNDAYRGGAGDDFYWENNTYSSDDTYIYDSGDDIISDFSGYDKIVFASGITSADITMHRYGNGIDGYGFQSGAGSLVIDVAGKGSISIVNEFGGLSSTPVIDRLEFSNGSFIDLTAVENGQNGTNANNTLTGADRSYYERDYLFGDGGNDTLNGGKGDDVLDGGEGSDSYIYNYTTSATGISSGFDLITDQDSGTIDTLTINGLPDPNKLSFYVRGTGYGNLDRSLVIKYDEKPIIVIEHQFIGGSGPGAINTIIVPGAFTIDVTNYQFDQIAEDAGGTMIGIQGGGSIHNRMFGSSQSDWLKSYDGNDLLNGGYGEDTLEGGLGNDTYIWNYAPLDPDMIVEEGGYDTLILNDIPVGQNVTLNRNIDGVGLDVRINGAQMVYIAGHFNPGKAIEAIQVHYTNGAVVNMDLSTLHGINGTTGNDTLTGSDNPLLPDDVIVGSPSLYGADGDDIISGGLGNDLLYGGLGNDTYIYSAGVDTISEAGNGGGSDTIKFGAGITAANIILQRAGLNSADLNILLNGSLAVIVKGQFNNGTPGVIETIRFSNNSTIDLTTHVYETYGTQSSDTINALEPGQGIDIINGMGGSDVLNGSNGNDTLDGGVDSDTLYCGDGNDIAIYKHAENGGASDTYYGHTGTDRLDLYFQSGSITDLIYNDLLAYKTFMSNAANTNPSDYYGPVYQFTSFGLNASGFESFKVYIDSAEINLATLTPVIGTDSVNTLNGDANDNIIFGKAGNDTLNGNGGNDILIGGLGNDAMSGGLGDDVYIIDSAADTITELASAGTDTIQSIITYALTNAAFANIENLTLLGSAAINGTGNALANIIIGNSANNTLTGGTGGDAMKGGLGDDIYVVDETTDITVENANEGIDTVQSSVTYTLSANIENITLTSTTAINATGNALDNILTGNTGINTLTGGLGNDTYVVNGTADVVVENANEGDDIVQSSVTYTLSNNVERLTLTGSAVINGTGNGADNIIIGNSANNALNGGDGNDILDGGLGNDAMTGGLGNDIYIINSASDTVTELANEGVDTIQSTITYALTSAAFANIENLTLIGTAVINATGNALNNTIIGNTANNILNGDLGADTLIGGLGNDTYVVDNSADIVIENAAEGTDLIQSTVTYTLSQNVENLTLAGTASVNATGNILNNTITGNSGDNILTGAGGTDTLIGGLGNDTYIVDSIADIVTEAASAGTDLVKSAVSYTLATNVENLTLLGYSSINAIGNALNNILIGNDGNNRLDGSTGNDTMTGGLGNDTYVVNSASDVIVENANEGTDKVESSATFTLSANVENLALTGTAAIGATGNALDNMLIGNLGNNALNGGDGNDYLDGGVGSDALAGGLGNDIYIIDNAADTVNEGVNSGIDTIQTTITYALTHVSFANIENLTLLGSGNLNGTGNALNNIITGNSGNNSLSGSDGDDILVGNAGNDTLAGGNNNDTLYGGAGLDAMTGGTGADIFVFEALSAFSNVDTISDFTKVQNDKLDIHDLLVGYTAGVSNIDDFVTVTTVGSNTSFLVDRDGAATAYSDQAIVTLTGITGLTVNDLFNSGHLIV